MKAYIHSIITLLMFFLIFTANQNLLAQPMSGSYTIGGTSADFDSISQAVNSLITNGVSGTVVFNIRPGAYEEQVIIPEIVGANATNTITFQSESGNAEDVYWQFENPDWINFNYVIRIDAADHLRFNNISFSSNLTNVTGGGGVVIAFHNGLSEDVIFDSNVFYGITNSGESKGVISGYHSVSFPASLKDLKILNNEFHGFGNGIKLTEVTGSTVNTGLEIINNNLESNPANRGIYVSSFFSPKIERNNIVIPNASTGIRVDDSYGQFSVINNTVFSRYYGIFLRSAFSNNPAGGTIANNMVIVNSEATGAGMEIQAYIDSLIIAFNSFVAFGSQANGTALRFALGNYTSNSFSLINNMFIHYGIGKACDIYAPSQTITQMDHNVLYTNGSVLARWGGTDYSSLSNLQSASGMNLNSVSKMPDFENPNDDLHLVACSIGDEELKGIPVAGITTDYDGQIRDALSPYIGADETYADPPHLFSSKTAFGVSDSPIHFAAGDLDGDGDSDVAVVLGGLTNKVEVHWNNNGNFSSTTELDFGLLPTVVKIADLDSDNKNDIICLSDTIFVRYGMGGGVFTPPFKMPGVGVNVNPPPSGSDFEIMDYNEDGNLDIIQSYMGIVGVETGYLAMFIGQGNRDFMFYEPSQPTGLDYPAAIKLADLNGDNKPEAIVEDFVNEEVGVYENILPEILVFLNAVVYNTNHGGSGPLHANLDVYDFDGNNYNDIMVGKWNSTDSLTFLYNDGSTPFLENILGVETDDFRSSVTFTAADYELDGDVDILYATTSSEISILLNDGAGNFESVVACNPVGGNNFDGLALTMLHENFNNDNLPDFAILTQSDSFYIYYNAGWIPTGIKTEDETEMTVTAYELFQNYPNPFNPSTNIRYSVPERSSVVLKIYDILGSEVSTLVNEDKDAGIYTVNFNASQLASGIYFYRLTAGTFVETKKMILLR